MSFDPRLLQQIVRQVPPQLRPLAIATALQESGGRTTAIGDGGHSAGGFQENDMGRGHGLSIAQREDPAGSVARFLKELLVYQQRGHTGADLAYATQRPADRASYIAGINRYLPQASQMAGAGGQQIAPMPQPQQSMQGSPTGGGFDTTKLLPALAMAHSQSIEGNLDRHALLRSIENARLPMQAGGAPQLPTAGGGQSASAYGASTLPASMVGGGQLLGHQLDRAGMATAPSILSFAKQIAGIYGQPITLGTGTNHSQMTTNGTQSAHWTGHALDLPATGTQLMRMGQAALIAAGAPRAWAMKQKAGLFNIGRHQIIFGTNSPALGGNHTNHLHIGEK